MCISSSGAQYLDGTTDITRTLHLGAAPSDRQRMCFTLVLKGHIALAGLVFPEGTCGHRMDACARIPLWSLGLDYNHGTGMYACMCVLQDWCWVLCVCLSVTSLVNGVYMCVYECRAWRRRVS